MSAGDLGREVDPKDALPVTTKPVDGPLSARIAAKPGSAHASEKAKIVLEAFSSRFVPFQVTKDKVTYTISFPKGITIQGDCVFIPQVACEPAPPVPLDPGGYMIQNPPLKVTDGTVREVPGQDGKPARIANFKESPIEAIQQVVANVVLR